MPGRSVLVVGESLVDIVHGADGRTIEYAGGSAANVAVALARLGRPVRFATAWADDERGRVLADHLARAGVALASDPHALDRTATAAATIGADGAASYEFDLEWRIGEVETGRPGGRCTCARSARSSSPGADQVLELVSGLRATRRQLRHQRAPRDHRHRPGPGGPGGADGRRRATW